MNEKGGIATRLALIFFGGIFILLAVFFYDKELQREDKLKAGFVGLTGIILVISGIPGNNFFPEKQGGYIKPE